MNLPVKIVDDDVSTLYDAAATVERVFARAVGPQLHLPARAERLRTAGFVAPTSGHQWSAHVGTLTTVENAVIMASVGAI